MSSVVLHPKSDEVPEIVPIVLQQAFKFHSLGRIDRQTYEEQLERLWREELKPRGLCLSIQSRQDGGASFLIQQSKSGLLCAEYECDAPAGGPGAALNQPGLLSPAVFPRDGSMGIHRAC